MAKKKNKLKKALKTLIPLLGIGAVMAGRGRKSMPVDPGVVVDPMPMNTGDTGMPGFDFRDMMIQEGGTGISPFIAAKGGRAGYGKGGKVSKGCGKVMAGRNKKTKYI